MGAEELFLASGRLALTSMVVSVAVVLARPLLAPRLGPRRVLRVHQAAGAVALLCALLHAAVYYLYLR